MFASHASFRLFYSLMFSGPSELCFALGFTDCTIAESDEYFIDFRIVFS